MTMWFGDPWPSRNYRAPVCMNDLERIATPVGEECYLCREAVADGDQGTAMASVRMDEDGAPYSGGLVFAHKECGLRNVVGCYGQLTGQDHSHDVPYREDARRVQDWVRHHGI